MGGPGVEGGAPLQVVPDHVPRYRRGALDAGARDFARFRGAHHHHGKISAAEATQSAQRTEA